MSIQTELNPIISRLHLKSFSWATPILASLVILGLPASAWDSLAPVKRIEMPALVAKAEAISPASIQDNSTQERAEVEIITIRPNGFEPAEIVRPKGRVLLAVNNSAGLDEVVLRLEREHGPSLHHVRVPRRKQNWRKVINLTPGSYTLTEVNHPGWLCRITITD